MNYLVLFLIIFFLACAEQSYQPSQLPVKPSPEISKGPWYHPTKEVEPEVKKSIEPPPPESDDGKPPGGWGHSDPPEVCDGVLEGEQLMGPHGVRLRRGMGAVGSFMDNGRFMPVLYFTSRKEANKCSGGATQVTAKTWTGKEWKLALVSCSGCVSSATSKMRTSLMRAGAPTTTNKTGVT